MSFHLIPYNLGCGAVVTHQTYWLESTYHLECGASCDSSDILVLKHRCDNMASGGVNDDLGVKACVTAAGSFLMRQVQDEGVATCQPWYPPMAFCYCVRPCTESPLTDSMILYS